MGVKPGDASEVLLPIAAPLPREEVEKSQQTWLSKLDERRKTWLEALQSVGNVVQATHCALDTLRRITERLGKHHHPEESRERYWAGPLEDCGRAFMEECAIVVEICNTSGAPASLAPRLLACAVRLAEALGSTGPLLVSLDGELSMVKERVEQLQVLYDVLLKRVDVFAGEVPYLKRCLDEEKAAGEQARADLRGAHHELHSVKHQLTVAERQRAELRNGLRIAKDDCAIAKAALAAKKYGANGFAGTPSTTASMISSWVGIPTPGSSSPSHGQGGSTSASAAATPTISVGVQTSTGPQRHVRHRGDHDRQQPDQHHHHDQHSSDLHPHHDQQDLHHDHQDHHAAEALEHEHTNHHRRSSNGDCTPPHHTIFRAVQRLGTMQHLTGHLSKQPPSPARTPSNRSHRSSAILDEQGEATQAPDPEASAVPQVPKIGRPTSIFSIASRRGSNSTPVPSPRPGCVSEPLSGTTATSPGLRNVDTSPRPRARTETPWNFDAAPSLSPRPRALTEQVHVDNEEDMSVPSTRTRAWTYEPLVRRAKSLAVPSLKSSLAQSTNSQGGACNVEEHRCFEERDGVSSWGDEDSSISTRSMGSVWGRSRGSTQLLARGAVWALSLSKTDPVVASTKAAYEHLAALVRKAVHLHPEAGCPQGEDLPDDIPATTGLKLVSEGVSNWAEADLHGIDQTLAKSILHAANNLRMLASLVSKDAAMLKGRCH